MRVVILFAPGFQAFGKAFMKKLQEKNPVVEIIGLAATRRTYRALKKDKTCNFLALECLESREKEWLAQPYKAEELKGYEEKFDPRVAGNILILDRLVGSGFVSCALPIETELTRLCRKPDILRAYMTGTFRYYDEIIQQYKPDAAFLYAIAGAQGGAIAWIFHERGIPVFKLQHTRVENRFMVDTSMTGLLDPLWQRFFKGETGTQASQERAAQWLSNFRENDVKPDYFVNNQHRMKTLLSPKKIIKSVAVSTLRSFYYLVFPKHKQLRSEDGFFKIRESIMVPLRSWRMAKESAYDRYDDLKSSDFIYFTLHVDPEASTMHLAPDFTDQLQVIEALAKRRPLHMNILVKEHPNMIGRRPRGFYNSIRKLPGVYLIHPSVPSIDLIRRAKLVFTITGTVAWESIVSGTPAAMLGDFPFLPFATTAAKGAKLARFHTLARDIREALAIPRVPDQDIVRLLSLLFDESFSLSSNLFWGEIDDAAVLSHISAVDTMAAQFLKRYAEHAMPSAAAA